MGKRKSRTDDNKTPPPSDLRQHAPQLELHSERRSCEVGESSATQDPPQSFMAALNNRSLVNKNHTLLLSSSSTRHSLARHYSQRNSTNVSGDASPSNWKATPPHDNANMAFKLQRQQDHLSDSLYRGSRDRIFRKQERIKSRLAQNAASGEVRRMECSICERRLRKHAFVIQGSISSSDLSVVAVLVCGHAYHAECLEQITKQEDSQDPTCPLCCL